MTSNQDAEDPTPVAKETSVVPVDTESTVDESVQPDGTSQETTEETSQAVETDAEASDEVTEGEVTDGEEAPEGEVVAESEPERKFSLAKAMAFGVLPAIALLLAAAAGYLKWQDNSVRAADQARAEASQVAKDSTIKLLSYKPDTVEQELGAARDLLTGEFRDSYTQLTNDVVIPGAKEKNISAVASVPAVAAISATPNRAEALVFVNQTVIVGDGAPTATASSVKVTMEKAGDRWLVSGFDPV